jgi:antibiotic biosynthesis monooxygenase (ABM) superfamily enzyme
MGSEHKKAMLAIFTILFICLLAGTIFITVQVQHYTIGTILLVTTIIIGADIRWVHKTQEPSSSFD